MASSIAISNVQLCIFIQKYFDVYFFVYRNSDVSIFTSFYDYICTVLS